MIVCITRAVANVLWALGMKFYLEPSIFGKKKLRTYLRAKLFELQIYTYANVVSYIYITASHTCVGCLFFRKKNIVKIKLFFNVSSET